MYISVHQIYFCSINKKNFITVFEENFSLITKKINSICFSDEDECLYIVQTATAKV